MITEAVQNFLDRLSKTPRTWKINTAGQIRNEAGQCPICAVAVPDLSKIDLLVDQSCYIMWWEHYKELGLSKRDARLIVLSADHDVQAFFTDYREPLLRACGLREL